MIDLSQSPSASPLVHAVAKDPGISWVKAATVAVDWYVDDAAAPRP